MKNCQSNINVTQKNIHQMGLQILNNSQNNFQNQQFMSNISPIMLQNQQKTHNRQRTITTYIQNNSTNLIQSPEQQYTQTQINKQSGYQNSIKNQNIQNKTIQTLENNQQNIQKKILQNYNSNILNIKEEQINQKDSETYLQNFKDTIRDQVIEIQYWSKKCKKMKECLEMAEQKLNEFQKENNQLNSIIQERSFIQESQLKAIENYENKLNVMINDNNKLNEICSQKMQLDFQQENDIHYQTQLIREQSLKINQLIQKNTIFSTQLSLGQFSDQPDEKHYQSYKQIYDQQQKYKEKQDEIEQIKQSFEELKRNIVIREEVIEISYRQNQQNQNILRGQLEDSEKLMEDFQNEIDSLQSELRKCKDQYDSQEQQINQTQNSNFQKDEEQIIYQRENDQLKQKINLLKQQNQTQQQELDKLYELLSQRKEQNDISENYSQYITSLEQQIQDLKQILKKNEQLQIIEQQQQTEQIQNIQEQKENDQIIDEKLLEFQNLQYKINSLANLEQQKYDKI